MLGGWDVFTSDCLQKYRKKSFKHESMEVGESESRLKKLYRRDQKELGWWHSKCSGCSSFLYIDDLKIDVVENARGACFITSARISLEENVKA
jgi:hypothetical protein